MRTAPYYSVRGGENKLEAKLDIGFLKRLFHDLYRHFNEKCYFQETFGYNCVDSGKCVGTVGSDIEAVLFLRLRKREIWPIHKWIDNYSQEDLFDIIEFCYDCIAKPTEHPGDYHNWYNCGWHYSEFDKSTGQREFREEINKLLMQYETPYELSVKGNILKCVEHGLETLVSADIPTTEIDNIKLKLERATLKFRYHRSSVDDQLDALKELAAVLEYLRPKAKKLVDKEDESELFNIANNFGIRHHNANQKTNYDKSIWYNWIFYYYLSTIHALLRLIEKSEQALL